MDKFKNLSMRETYDRVKNDLKTLHRLATNKGRGNEESWEEMMDLMRDIHFCTKRLEPQLQEPLKADLNGIVDDFKDYSYDTTKEDRRAFCDYLNKNIENVLPLLDHLKTKAA